MHLGFEFIRKCNKTVSSVIFSAFPIARILSLRSSYWGQINIKCFSSSISFTQNWHRRSARGFCLYRPTSTSIGKIPYLNWLNNNSRNEIIIRLQRNNNSREWKYFGERNNNNFQYFFSQCPFSWWTPRRAGNVTLAHSAYWYCAVFLAPGADSSQQLLDPMRYKDRPLPLPPEPVQDTTELGKWNLSLNSVRSLTTNSAVVRPSARLHN